MTFPTISPVSSVRALYRLRRSIALLAAIAVLVAVLAGATYALGAGLGHDATSQIEQGTP